MVIDTTERGKRMLKPFIIYSSRLTDRYHPSGAALVHARDPENAKRILVNYLVSLPNEYEDEDADAPYAPKGSLEDLYEAMDEVVDVSNLYNKPVIFPNSGCC